MADFDMASNPANEAETAERDEIPGSAFPSSGPVVARSPLQDFLEQEANDFVRSELLGAIDQLGTGQQRYFTFNVFNVRLEADAQLATVEDELDVERSETLALDAFADLLRTTSGPKT